MPGSFHLSPRASPFRRRGASPRRSPRARSPSMARTVASSPRGYEYHSPRDYRATVAQGSPGARVVDAQRFVREVPRTIYDQEEYELVTEEVPVGEHIEWEPQVETVERTVWETDFETRERTEWDTVEEPVVVVKTRQVPRLVTEWVEEEYETIDYETYDVPRSVLEDVPVQVQVTYLEDVEVDVPVRVTDYETVTKEVPVYGGGTSPVWSSYGSPYQRRETPRGKGRRSPRRLDYGASAIGTSRSLRERESGWNI